MKKAQTVKTILARGCRYGGNKPALVSEGTSYSFNTLQQRVKKLANGFLDLGLHKGDRVAILSKNSVVVAESYLSVPSAGLVLVVLNYRFSPKELLAVLIDSSPQVLLVSEDYLELVRQLEDKLSFIKWFVHVDGNHNVSGKWTHYSTILSRGVEKQIPVDVANGDLAALMYTSGTTGTPKGCMITHQNLFHAGHSLSVEMDMTDTDVGLVPVPLFHASGQCLLLTCVYSGCTAVIQPCWDIGNFVNLVTEYKVTATMLATPMVTSLVAVSEGERDRIVSLKKVLFAGAPASAVIWARAIERFGNIFIHGFGTTETVGSISILQLDDLQHALDSGYSDILKSCGRGYMDMEVEIVDESRKKRVAPLTIGEVRVRGKGVSRGYWRKPKETRRAFVDEWFYTEDLAVVDERGFISIVGRMKDMIISGAENVFPAEVENILQKHPAVYQAAVIGIADEKWGEAVTAYIQLKAGKSTDAESIINFCKQEIASYKAPKSIHFVDQLPLSATGKILKGKLKGAVHNFAL
ncbi:class I adenylate-forming enzyme family protein [Desulforhopalus singaporensis]|nr:AMP-binding protein [Desulforhopalus singaporensis]